MTKGMQEFPYDKHWTDWDFSSWKINDCEGDELEVVVSWRRWMEWPGDYSPCCWTQVFTGEQQVQRKHKKMLPHLMPNCTKPPVCLHGNSSFCLKWSVNYFSVVFRVNRKSCSVTGGVLGWQEHAAKWVPKNIWATKIFIFWLCPSLIC